MATSAIEGFFKPTAALQAQTSSFLAVLEDHMTYLRNLPETMVLEVTGHDANVYAFDWIGLLTKIGVPVDLHWVVIRLNGYMSYTDVPADLRSLYVPPLTEVNKLLQLHASSRKVR